MLRTDLQGIYTHMKFKQNLKRLTCNVTRMPADSLSRKFEMANFKSGLKRKTVNHH